MRLKKVLITDSWDKVGRANVWADSSNLIALECDVITIQVMHASRK